MATTKPSKGKIILFYLYLAGGFLSLLCVPVQAQTLSTWTSTTSYPASIDGQSCVVNSGYVYCIGGNVVYYAPLNSSGVGSWTATTSYPTYIEDQSCVVNSGYVYCVGGDTGGSVTNAVYYASLSASGVGSWTATTSYPASIDGQSCVVNSGYVYCVGNNMGYYGTAVYYAPLSSSGVGSWTATTSYPTSIIYQSCVVNSGYVYCFGGYNGTNAVYYAPLTSSGVGSWTATTSYPTSIDYQSCVVNSGVVYCVGGYNGSSDTNAVYYAPLSSSGVGSWTTATSYPTNVSVQSCVVNSGYVYCFGGSNGSSLTNAVYYAGIEPPTPSNLSAMPLGASSITWEWNAVPGATSYDFYPSTGGTPINLSGTTFTQTNLSTNTSYGSQVSALNSIEASPLSTLVSTYTFAAPPTGFVFTQVNVSSIAVSWNTNTNPSGTSYQVQYWQPGGSTTSLTTTATQESITGLQLGASYYLTVNALNGDNVSAPSNETLFLPPAPSGLTASIGISSIVWTWNAVSGATSYDFYPSTGGAPINLSGTTFTQTNLSTNTSYGAQVSEIGATNQSLASPIVSTYTLASPPTGFAFTQVNVSSIAVSWNSNTNPAGTSYKVQYWQLGGSTTSLTTTATQETITGLSIAATYYLTLSALNGNGIAAPSGVTLSTTTFIPPSVSTSIGSSGGVMIYNGIFGSDNLQIPAGAYSQNVQVTLQTPDQSNLACNASPAENLTSTDIALEVDLNPDIEPVNTVTVSLSYANASIGSMNPEQFLIARCDSTNNTWTPLPSTLDTSAKTVTATSDHLSIFQIMSGTPPTSVSQYKVGPNPLRPSLGESQMKFLVPPNSDIKIYTLTGELVNDITAAPDGTASWNATNRSGRAVASGVYFVLIRGNGQSKTIKVIVER